MYIILNCPPVQSSDVVCLNILPISCHSKTLVNQFLAKPFRSLIALIFTCWRSCSLAKIHKSCRHPERSSAFPFQKLKLHLNLSFTPGKISWQACKPGRYLVTSHLADNAEEVIPCLGVTACRHSQLDSREREREMANPQLDSLSRERDG